MHRPRSPIALPGRQAILDFIARSDQPAGKREIARAFGLKGSEKIALKALLKDMADEGLIDSAPGRAFHRMGGVPKVTVLRIVDVEGERPLAVPDHWQAETPPPRLVVIERTRKAPAFGVGDRFLARTEEVEGRGWCAYPMKRLARGEEMILGIVSEPVGQRHWLRPVDKRIRRDTPISDLGGARAGQIVRAQKSGRAGHVSAQVVDVIGEAFAPRAFSLIAIEKHGLPHVFSVETLAEAEQARAFSIADSEREDLTALPIVAIDPVDARDHDDAVWAEPDPDPGNVGGFRLIVVIADVSFYVRPGSRVDREARKRGNSAYFPDRVVPMLPEILSADLCSLKAGEDRAGLACHMVIDARGRVKVQRFSRARVRIAANLPYEDAQARIDADPADDDGLTRAALRPLWAAWAVLTRARDQRGPLELDLPERRVELDPEGRIVTVAPRARLDAHRLIEDLMIAANVAAAKALESKRRSLIYRAHEPPARDKLIALKEHLATYDLNFALGQVVTPATFNRLIEQIGDRPERPQIMEAILRCQTQAYYTPAAIGHFGLNLGSYAHFTSPIRRYADLIVHRALVSAFHLGVGGLTDEDEASLVRTADHVSLTERRAMEAERETVDRYVAAFLADKVGEVLPARITGVASFGFFATVEGIGGDGLVPASTLGNSYFRFDEKARALVSADGATRYALGDTLSLKLVEADIATGALRFALDGDEGPRKHGGLSKPRGRGSPRSAAPYRDRGRRRAR